MNDASTSSYENLGFTANPSPWQVINYQIPVPIGDCSAHFLVDTATKKVHRAFLMDGGMNAGMYVAWVQILKGLRFIDLELGNGWKFDSWVVTHWDADHYHGVKDLLLNKDITFTRCKRDGNTVTRSSPNNFASLYFAEDAWLCCGAWDVKAMFNGGGDFLRHFVKENERDRWDQMDTASQRSSEGKRLLRCKWGEELIGLDLFTRSRQFIRKTGQEYKPTYSRRRSKEDCENRLDSDENTADAENTPRFCVVGANGFGIGQPKAVKAGRPTRNETSILALLYWKRQKLCSYYTGGDGYPDVFNGPVQTWFNKTWPNSDVEMVKLDHHGSTRENLGGAHRSAVKSENNPEQEEQPSESESDSEAESNGEEQEGPLTDPENIGLIIEYMEPRKVLVTPGSSHGHPTWDVLAFLRDYFERLSDANGNQSAVRQGLFTTRAAYWFSKEEVTLKDINFNHRLGEAFEGRKRLTVGDGSESIAEEVQNDGEGDETSDEDFDILYALSTDAHDRADGQERWVKAKERYVQYILQQDKNRPRLDRNGKTKYNLWTGKDGNKPNYAAVKKAVNMAIEDQDKENRSREALEREKYMRNPPRKGTEAALKEELWAAHNELIETTDDAQLEGVENFEEICWQPLPALQTEDPHFLIRFEFGDRRENTVLQVFDDSGQFEYVKKAVQVDNGSDQVELQVEPVELQVEPVEQSEAIPTGRLAADDHSPWAKYAYGECAIATMLSEESLKTALESKRGARAKKSSGKNMTEPPKREPENMVFKYYNKRKAAIDGIKELLKMAQADEDMGNDSTAKPRGRPKKPTNSASVVKSSRKANMEVEENATDQPRDQVRTLSEEKPGIIGKTR
ncbi:hypothetical protein BBK36DRAFT_1145146 [Trichoderma citrinoviride]|uniref:Metallo-beta-lactamase domain-containing protein n=1 Tax=Trichoderma citrinoviride TaxID=58853 RepID=A0A2T4AYB4_9HYPO|nr:hypothetical protein BBK36DRAFT_1145146 [Trichoderma citrinoviride]PTB62069.1 hypothetical protein BBK36DRAFT_1145146 [Trichoderma citrinoviride]